jgi:gas vesicle protein
MNKKALTYGFILGSAAGAITALINAPSSGKVLRGQLRETTNDWSKNITEIKESLISLKNSVSKLSSEGKDIALELIYDIKTSVNQWQKETEPNKQALFDEMKAIQKTIKELELKTSNHS